MSPNAKEFYADTNAPVCNLEVKEHFELLTEKEKRYAHHISRASHYGTRVVLRQVSPESEKIYDIILEVHAAIGGDWDKLTEKVSADDLKLFLEYASQFLSNLGNYKSFGDVKFIPRISQESFENIVSVSPKATELFKSIATVIYSVSPEAANLL